MPLLAFVRKNARLRIRHPALAAAELLLPLLTVGILVVAFLASTPELHAAANYAVRQIDVSDPADLGPFTPRNISTDEFRGQSGLDLASAIFAGPTVVPTLDQMIRLHRFVAGQFGDADIERVIATSAYGHSWGYLLMGGSLRFAPDSPRVRDLVAHLNATSAEFASLDVHVHATEAAAVEALLDEVDDRTWALVVLEEEEEEEEVTIRVNASTIPNPEWVVRFVDRGVDFNHARYFLSGFLTLQHEVARFLGRPVPAVAVPFPTAAFERNLFLFTLGPLFGVVLVLSTILPMARLVEALVREKEAGLVDLLLVSGASRRDIQGSWVVTSLGTYLVTSGGSTALLCASSMVQHTGPEIVLALFLLLAAAEIAFALFLGNLFRKQATLAAVCAPVALFASLLPKFLFLAEPGVAPEGASAGVSLLAPAAFAFAADRLGHAEYSGTGLALQDVSQEMGFLALDTALYLLLAWLAASWESFAWVDFLGFVSARPGTGPEKVQVSGLRKEFERGRPVVDGLDLVLRRGEITALLGHNGAGKSTTIAMLTGLVRPTAGTVFVDGATGLCPQHSVLWPALSAAEHVELLAAVKGVSPPPPLPLPGLDADRRAGALSGGQRRKLSVALALVGEPALVIFDEPTAAMDPQSRRDVWDLLRRVQQTAAVLLTTHLLEEADVLADRVVVLQEGRVQCAGSPLELKARYGLGYTLQTAAPDALVQGIVPQACRADDDAAASAWRLPLAAANDFPRLFAALEAHGQYQLQMASMESVFLRLASVRETPEPLSAPAPCVGRRRRGDVSAAEQLRLLLRKRVVGGLRDTSALLVQVVIPALLVALVVGVLGAGGRATSLPALRLDESIYDERTEVAFAGGEGAVGDVGGRWAALLDLPWVNTSQELGDYLLDTYGTHELSRYAAFVANDTVFLNVTFNPTTVADLPLEPVADVLGLREEDLVGAALLLAAPELEAPDLPSFWEWEVVNDTLRLTNGSLVVAVDSDGTVTGDTEQVADLLPELDFDFDFNFNRSFTVLVPLAPATPTVLHNTTSPHAVAAFSARFSGMGVTTHPLPLTARESLDFQEALAFYTALFLTLPVSWFTAAAAVFAVRERLSLVQHVLFLAGVRRLVYHAANFAFDAMAAGLVGAACLVVFVAADVAPFVGDGLGPVAALLLSYCAAAVPLSYAFGLLFDSPTSAQVAAMAGGVVAGFLTMVAVDVAPDATAETLDGLFRVLLPQYVAGDALADVGVEHWRREYGLASARDPWDVVAPAVSTLWTHAAVGWAVLALHGMRAVTVPAPHAEGSALELEEARKTFGRRGFVALEGLTLRVPVGECCGLLGTNGAGKSTAMRLLTGEARATAGSAAIQPGFGYCPQPDPLCGELTPREHVELFARLAGMARPADFADQLLGDVGLRRDADRRSGRLSGGNKRKLSLAVALAGAPAVVVLDEPTAGVDPVARRRLWDVIKARCATTLLCTHSMEECEALCERVAVLVAGRLQLLGRPAEFEAVLGWTLTVKAATRLDCAWLPEGAALKEAHGTTCAYSVPEAVPLAELFRVIESRREELGIEFYSVGKASMQEVFESVV